MRISKIFSKIRKVSLKSKLSAALLLAVALPITGGIVSANTNLIEGWVKSRNMTTGQTEYQDSTSAKADDVVQVELWHHNRNNPAGEQVSNTVVKFNVPSTQGRTQVISGTSASDNGNTISDSTTVNLTMDEAKVEYIPGSAKFRYNKGAAQGDASCETGFDYPPDRCYATVVIPDTAVSSGVNLDTYRGGPLRGCNAHHETVTIQVRVKVSVISVNKYVRHLGQGASDWKTTTNAKPGDQLEYMIRYQNHGNTMLNNVMVGDNLPKYNAYTNGTTKIATPGYPNGVAAGTDNVVHGGINVGNYGPGTGGYVWFTVKLDPSTSFEKCGGNYDLRNVGLAKADGINVVYNTAQVLVDVACVNKPPAPTFRCDLLTAKAVDGKARTFKFKTNATAQNGATIRRYFYNFGDGTPELVTDKAEVEHTYRSDQTFGSTVKVEFNANNKQEVATSTSCAVSIVLKANTPPAVLAATTPTPTPTVLPNTGAGSTIAIFTVVSAISAFGYHLVVRRRS